ncbi:MAG TPA: MFS transporter [Caulobacteraceae bacterium]|nr:MFS transporter [Caulobacteraceae bacterium]
MQLNRAFSRLWAAQAVSDFGALISREGLPLAAVLSLGAGPVQLGVLAAARAAPAVLVGFGAGRIVDRGSRRAILIAADLGRAAVLVLVAVAALGHHLTAVWLYLAAALVRALSDLFDVADHAILPALVARQQLLAANARLAATESAAEVGGPALAGVLFTLLTAPIAIGLNAVTYLASAALLAGLPRRAPSAPSPAGRSPPAPGLALAFASPLLRPLILASGASALAGGFFSALYILFAIRTLGLTPAMLGITIGAGGVGALAGAALAGPTARRFGFGPALIGAWLLSGGFAFLVPLAHGRWSGMAMLMLAQVLGDAAGAAALVHAKTVRQTAVADHELGRAAAAFTAVGGAAAAAGALAGGYLALGLGVRGALFAGSAGLLAAPLFCLVRPLRSLREVGAGQG